MSRFQGSYVALITPFTHGVVDERALRHLVNFQIENGTDGIVACGTTGEAATLSLEEWSQVVATVVDAAGGRVPVLAGTGSNSTAATIARTQQAAGLGADGALVVTPYYNKPTQEGLFRHFSAVAEACDLPLMLYNVPGRTGVNLLPATVARLAEVPGIVALKEAAGSLDQASEVVLETPQDFAVLSGDDSLTAPMMTVGARGVVSVVANIAPRAVSDLVSAMLRGDLAEGERLHRELFPLARALFVESNPIPVKTAAAWLGLCGAEMRPPLSPIGPAAERHLRAVVGAFQFREVMQSVPA